MLFNKIGGLIGMVCILLTGCKQSLTYDYLIENPSILEKETLRCKTDPRPQCKIVLLAMKEFTDMNEIQYIQPQRFGGLIMQTQFDMIKMQKKLRDSKIDANELKQTKETYQLLQNRLKLMMSVIRQSRLE